jgi:8-oxo-dGTP pyrophosphatase MutT (NUDIX family)
MYISIHEPSGIVNINSAAEFDSYKKDKKIIEAAGGLVFNKQQELLMIFRRGFWDLPKGKVDKGETLEQCAVREVMEETGLQHIHLDEFLTTTYHTYHQNGDIILKPSHWFKMVSALNESLVPQTEEDITEIKWVSKTEVQQLKEHMYPTIKRLVEQYF